MLRTRYRDGLLKLSQMQQHGGRLPSREWQQERYAVALERCLASMCIKHDVRWITAADTSSKSLSWQ